MLIFIEITYQNISAFVVSIKLGTAILSVSSKLEKVDVSVSNEMQKADLYICCYETSVKSDNRKTAARIKGII
jgi:hypothetical protein